MGNNGAYMVWEETVVSAYDKGLLNAELLSVLMEPYRGIDIDSGGSRDLTAKDGLNVEQIVLKTFGVECPERPELPPDSTQWSAEQEDISDQYHDTIANLFFKVTERFGWG